MIEKLKEFSPDLKIRTINNIKIIYLESICNINTINDFILRPIIKFNINSKYKLINKLPDNIVNIKYEDIYLYLYSGFTIINIKNSFIGVETKYQLDSGINEASNEKVIKGPKDAFSENYQSNIGLIRKRIRSDKLRIKEYTIGNISKTKVSLIYMDYSNKELVNNIDKSLSSINLDYVGNSNYIIESISNNSIFQDHITTERPDFVSFNLINGRICLLIENSNQVIILPCFFNDYFKTIDDYYQNTKNVNITRIIRFISFFVSIIIPGFYIALTTFNQETLPTNILINFSMQKEGVPFPSIIEALLLFLTFEILREADTRVPFVVGSSMSIVGALVLGEAAVEAGLISPIMIIVIAISSVASFLFNDNDTVNTIRIWKLIFLLLSSIAGLYGLFIAFLLFLIKICSLDSFGYEYVSNDNFLRR